MRIAIIFITCICIYPQDRVDKIEDNIWTRPSTVQTELAYLIEVYEQECYADSSARYYYILCDWECWEVPCTKDSLDDLGRPCPEHWEHRSSTWEGFMEFIKKELK